MAARLGPPPDAEGGDGEPELAAPVEITPPHPTRWRAVFRSEMVVDCLNPQFHKGFKLVDR